MSCRSGSPAAASSMRCFPRGGACSRPSALCSTFSLGSAPSGASWSAAQHDDQCTHASPLSGCKSAPGIGASAPLSHKGTERVDGDPGLRWKGPPSETTKITESPPTLRQRDPWNKGRLIGQKRPLKPKDVWTILVRLQLEGRKRDLATFNLAIDSKLRGCDLVRVRIDDVCAGGRVRDRATVIQKKTGRPVQFEITEQTRSAAGGKKSPPPKPAPPSPPSLERVLLLIS